jgi:leader peptidase (prepilin peptidase)/N-methyltransferase
LLDLPARMTPFVLAWVAVVGAVVGSFLNVVIARVPAGESVVRPRSRCPGCHAAIAWFDNVPVLSWLLLRARCRSCRTRIPARYPLVEMAGAGIALLAFHRHGLGAQAAAEFAFSSTLLALALIDLDTWLLPHVLTWPLLAAGLALSTAGVTPAGTFTTSAWGAGVGFAAFAAISVAGERLFRREAMGFGDVWLLAGLGAWLGIQALLPVVLLSSLQGSVVGLALAAGGRLPRGEAPPPPGDVAAGVDVAAAPAADEDWVPPRNAVPFGPFLVAGALEWMYLGSLIERAWPALRMFH